MTQIRHHREHAVYVDRLRLRRMRPGETITIGGLPAGAVAAARVQCCRVGREKGCRYTLRAWMVRADRYMVEITRCLPEDEG